MHKRSIKRTVHNIWARPQVADGETAPHRESDCVFNKVMDRQQ
jgi:hypothetical protein